MKQQLNEWNKNKFGNIHTAVQKTEVELIQAKRCLQDEVSDDAQQQVHDSQAKLMTVLVAEEKYWKQKARIKWLDVEYKNTKYFHEVVRQRRVKSLIHRIQNAGGN